MRACTPPGFSGGPHARHVRAVLSSPRSNKARGCLAGQLTGILGGFTVGYLPCRRPFSFFCHGSLLVVGLYLIFFLLSFVSSFLFFLSFLSFLLFLFVLLFMLLLSRRDYARRRSLFSL